MIEVHGTFLRLLKSWQSVSRSEKKGYLYRTPEALASQRRIWKTEVVYYSEEEMADYFRANGVRAILDMGWPSRLSMPGLKDEVLDKVFQRIAGRFFSGCSS